MYFHIDIYVYLCVYKVMQVLNAYREKDRRKEGRKKQQQQEQQQQNHKQQNKRKKIQIQTETLPLTFR